MKPTAETTVDEPRIEKPNIPWYSLDIRHVSRQMLLRATLIILVLLTFSIVPIWRLGWYLPIYSASNFASVKDTHGQKQQTWRWVTGKEIRVYQLPKVRAGQAEQIASGVRELVKDAGLDFTVKVMPIPPAILAAYEASIVQKPVNGVPQSYISVNQLESRLIELRLNDPHADMLVVNLPIAECWWAHGIATFNSGLSLLEDDFVSPQLGKHESCHLVGYSSHDSLPLYVIGYRWEGFPWSRDTLMMLNGNSEELSPRAFDALRYFWRRMEKRLGMQFLK